MEMHSPEAEKLQAMEKFPGMQKLNKLFPYFIISVTVARFCWSAVEIEPILEALLPPFRLLCQVSIPQVLKLCSNSTFLFVLCNVIILTLTMNSGLLRNSNGNGDFSCKESVKRNGEIPPERGAVSETKNRDEITASSLAIVELQSDSAAEDDLRRRIEDFIAKVHLQMRLQRQADQPWNVSM